MPDRCAGGISFGRPSRGDFEDVLAGNRIVEIDGDLAKLLRPLEPGVSAFANRLVAHRGSPLNAVERGA